jgi:hypothetical protein
MKFDTQTKKNMLSSKVTKAEVTDRIQKATLYNREVIRKQKHFHSPAEASILIQHVVRQS